jgi:hypothetical protein
VTINDERVARTSVLRLTTAVEPGATAKSAAALGYLTLESGIGLEYSGTTDPSKYPFNSLVHLGGDDELDV